MTLSWHNGLQNWSAEKEICHGGCLTTALQSLCLQRVSRVVDLKSGFGRRTTTEAWPKYTNIDEKEGRKYRITRCIIYWDPPVNSRFYLYWRMYSYVVTQMTRQIFRWQGKFIYIYIYIAQFKLRGHSKCFTSGAKRKTNAVIWRERRRNRENNRNRKSKQK